MRLILAYDCGALTSSENRVDSRKNAFFAKLISRIFPDSVAK